MDNVEITGYINLWSADTSPWQESRIWFYPTFTRIDNVEQS